MTLIVSNLLFLLYAHYKDVNNELGKLRERKDYDKIQHLIITFYNNYNLFKLARYIILVINQYKIRIVIQ